MTDTTISPGQKSSGAGSQPLQELSLADRIKQIESKYTIPALVKEKFPDLIELVLQTDSMNEEERDYWFQILPIMTEEQIAKFKAILVNEKGQLKKLDEKHTVEWQEFEYRKKREALEKAETSHETVEKAKEEELLKLLEDKS